MSDLTFDPTAPAFIASPYEMYARLRAEAPVHEYVQDGKSYWLLSRYADVRGALLDHETFTVERGTIIQDTPDRAGKSLGTTDPPRHDELRRVYNRAFTPPRLKATEADMRSCARGLIDAFRERRSFDLVSEYATPFVNHAIGRIIGIRPQDLDEARRLLSAVYSETTYFGASLNFAALPALNEFMLRQTNQRQHEQTDDLMFVLFQAREESDFATNEQIAAASTAVLVAGFSTVVHLLGSTLAALHRHPGQLHALLADPGLTGATVEEGARFDTPVQGLARQTTREVEISGVTVPKDARVVLIYGSANHDDELTPQPEEFRLDRGHLNHLGFGSGAHFCLGAPLARFCMRVALQELMPVVGADYELDEATARRPIDFSVRGYSRLDITF